nr:hypothetical protein [uncultured Ruminococcus sp.]
MKLRLFIMITAVILAVTCVLSACGNDSSTAGQATPDSSAVQETTVVLVENSDGSTVEKDSEGNKISKDKDGEITKVVDKNGNEVDITEYIRTHSWITTSLTNAESSSSAKGSGSGAVKDSENGKTSASSSAKSESSVSSEDAQNGVEDEIPVLVASAPDPSELDDEQAFPDI